tara:strand:- start:42231 stop:43493 length:1263 start_codon:yes stop_codon:yes gene_type:complete
VVSILNVAPSAATGTGKPVSSDTAAAEPSQESGRTGSFGAILADETAGQSPPEVTGLQLDQAVEEGGNERQYSGKFLPGHDDADSAGVFAGDVVTPGGPVLEATDSERELPHLAVDGPPLDAGESELELPYMAADERVQPAVVADTRQPPAVAPDVGAPIAVSGISVKPALNELDAASAMVRPAPGPAVVASAVGHSAPVVADNTALDGVISANELQPGLGRHSAGPDSGQHYSEVVDSVELAPSRLAAAASQSAAPALNTPRPPGGDAAMPRTESMSLPMGHESWGDELASRVSLLVKNGASEARLQLNPAGLGHLAIDIQTDGDKASITFHAQQGTTRDAIEQAMPRLREMFEQSGLQLTQSSVSDQSQSGQRNGGQASDAVAALQAQEADGSETGLPDASSYLPGAGMASALVDYYA